MSQKNDIFDDFLKSQDKPQDNISQSEDNGDANFVKEANSINTDKKTDSLDLFNTSSSDDLFGQSLSSDDAEYHKPVRRQFREAKIKMTKEEYRKRLEELNENAENKNFVILFGIQNSGKSYIIASLLHYMNAYLEGNTRLNKDIATKEESLLYNQMAEMFMNPDKGIGRTDINKFSELNVIYTPNTPEKQEVELTFLDASGENLKQIYEGGDDEYKGELPDYLEAILESDVNCRFAFVYDPTNNRQGPPQAQILKAMYDKVLEVQDRYDKIYPKVLLIAKSDKLSEKMKQKYGHSATEYALAKENNLRSFAQGFFSEKYSQNRSIFYQMGTFTKYDDLDKFDADCPHRLFDWIYRTLTGDTVLVAESLWTRFLRWLFGR